MESQPTFGDNNRGNQIGLYVDSSGRVFGTVSTHLHDSLSYG